MVFQSIAAFHRLSSYMAHPTKSLASVGLAPITELKCLVRYACPDSTATEYLDADQDLSVSFTIDPEEMEIEQWRDRLQQEALAISRNEVPCSEDEENDNKLEVEENCITTTRHKCVENLYNFFAKMKTSQ